MNRKLTRLAGIAFVILTMTGNGNAAEFIPLGSFADGEFASHSPALANNGKHVVADRYATNEEVVPPYRWQELTGTFPLGDSPNRSSFSNAITDDGQLVVGSHLYDQPGLREQAFAWTPGAGYAPLVGIPEAATLSRATDVTPDGQFIVGVAGIENDSAYHTEAFRVSQLGDTVLLGDLPGGQRSSIATSISADGSVITGYSLTDHGFHAFLWTPGTGMVDLQGADSDQLSSLPNNISADGKVVVGQSIPVTGGPSMAFRWTTETGIVSIGAFEDEHPSSFATSVSGDGAVVVGSSHVTDTIPGIPNRAFIWDAKHGIQNLHQVLVESYGLSSVIDGWNLYKADDISVDGLSIVGTGRNPSGNTEAWLVRLDRPLTAPEPSAALLVILAMHCIALKARIRGTQ